MEEPRDAKSGGDIIWWYPCIDVFLKTATAKVDGMNRIYGNIEDVSNNP
jgi:hypothetical protein